MVNKVKIAVLISGRGSNLQALIKACEDKDFPGQISLVISNKKDAYGLEIARNHNIKTCFIDYKEFNSREEFDRKMSLVVEENNCEIICLAGFMRLLSSDFVKKWDGKLINIHPSLLPAFKGANAVEDAFNYGVKFAGCTTHFVVEEMDSGPIIKQAVVEVLESDNKETLAKRILEQEHRIYPESLRLVCENI